MSEEPSVKLFAPGWKLVLQGLAPALAEQLFKQYLEERGWIVDQPREWETPKAFCTRIGIDDNTLIRKLRDPGCPKIGTDRARNGRGRLRALAPTHAFEAFCLRHVDDRRPRKAQLENNLASILNDHRKFCLQTPEAIRLIERQFTPEVFDQDILATMQKLTAS